MNEPTLYHGDCLQILKGLPDNSVDACVTDPPYGLSFMGKKWDYDVPATEIWQEVFRVLKPGANLLSFFGTRTYHRGVVRVEDAGFRIVDQIGWVFGSGFPKHKTHLKPAWEPIVLACKPGEGRFVNIDDCRIGTEDISSQWDRTWKDNTGEMGQRYPQSGRIPGKPVPVGRWPANLIHDGSADVLAGFPTTKSGAVLAHHQRHTLGGNGNTHGKMNGVTGPVREQSEGSAARFFYCAKASKADRGEGNTHPTVKPTTLMRYLCRLITPPGGLVLDPFMGSGSTGKAAISEGFDFVGIEKDETYFNAAAERIAQHRTRCPQLELISAL